MPFCFCCSVWLGTSDNIAQGVETVKPFLKKFLLFQKVFVRCEKCSVCGIFQTFHSLANTVYLPVGASKKFSPATDLTCRPSLPRSSVNAP